MLKNCITTNLRVLYSDVGGRAVARVLDEWDGKQAAAACDYVFLKSWRSQSSAGHNVLFACFASILAVAMQLATEPLHVRHCTMCCQSSPSGLCMRQLGPWCWMLQRLVQHQSESLVPVGITPNDVSTQIHS